MKFANVIGLVSACQHTRNRSVKSEIDREYSDENALLQPKSLWATLHELAVQGEAEKLVALCYDMYLTANVDLCVKTAAAGEGLIKKNVWSNWGEWTSCTQTCGTGKRTRVRKCLHNHSSAPCEGNQLQESTCNEFSCPFWSNWNEWLSCTKTCGGVKVLGSWLRSKTFFCFYIETSENPSWSSLSKLRRRQNWCRRMSSEWKRHRCGWCHPLRIKAWIWSLT